MKRFWLTISMILLPTLAAPCQAGGIFFKKRTRPVEPSTRVPELIITLKTGQRANKRADAAEELRQFDTGVHPEIVPALVDTMQSDDTWSVRREAAKTLGRLRPISPTAGKALQKAAKADSNLLVRLQARSSLWGYYLGGFRGSEDDPVAKDTTKPIIPLIDPKAPPVVQNPPAGPVLAPTQVTPGVQETPDVLVIAPKVQTPKAEVPRPLPKGRPWTTAVPAEPLRQTPPPPVVLENSGPSLTPPPTSPPKF